MKLRVSAFSDQTRPQELMRPQNQNPYLDTSDWIHFSHRLHVAFALEAWRTGD
jgi:hypothetical protein